MIFWWGLDRARILLDLKRFHRSKKYVGVWDKYFQDRHRSVPSDDRGGRPWGRHHGYDRLLKFHWKSTDLRGLEPPKPWKSRFSIRNFLKFYFFKNVPPIDCRCPRAFRVSGNFIFDDFAACSFMGSGIWSFWDVRYERPESFKIMKMKIFDQKSSKIKSFSKIFPCSIPVIPARSACLETFFNCFTARAAIWGGSVIYNPLHVSLRSSRAPELGGKGRGPRGAPALHKDCSVAAAQDELLGRSENRQFGRFPFARSENIKNTSFQTRGTRGDSNHRWALRAEQFLENGDFDFFFRFSWFSRL